MESLQPESPKAKRNQINVTLPDDSLLAGLKVIAAKERTTVSALAAEGFRWVISKRPRKRR